MNLHAVVRRHLPLLLYGECGPWKAKALERHLHRCQNCRRDYEELQALHRLLVETENAAVPEAVLEDARSRVLAGSESQRRTGHAPRRRDIGTTIAQAVRRPRRVLAGTVQVLAGAAAGFFLATLLRPSEVDGRAAADALPSEHIRIENVRVLGNDAEGQELELTLEAYRPLQIRGPVDDPHIQRLLARAILSDRNAGVRLRAVSMLQSPAHHAVDPEIRRALLTAMMTDDNAGVRMAALESVRQQSPDRESRDALLYVLLYDTNPGLRIAAINALEVLMTDFTGEDDAALRDHMGELQSDDNAYVRWKARTVLERGAL
jgi:hypothetical protein